MNHINIMMQDELLPLMVASSPVIFKILLEHGADVDGISRVSEYQNGIISNENFTLCAVGLDSSDICLQ